MRAAQVLQQGGLWAHPTSTVAGLTAHASHIQAIQSFQQFKQRQGPFLLLADSISTALKQARTISPTLRKMAKEHCPGSVTLLFSARPHAAPLCQKKGTLAVRVDGDPESRRLARLCGGLLLSSSFNRRGQAIMPLTRGIRWQFSRHLNGMTPSIDSIYPSSPSKIYRLQRGKVQRLR